MAPAVELRRSRRLAASSSLSHGTVNDETIPPSNVNAPKKRTSRNTTATSSSSSKTTTKKAKKAKTTSTVKKTRKVASSESSKAKQQQQQKPTKQRSASKTSTKAAKKRDLSELPCLPRTIELQCRRRNKGYHHIIGIDEAGRGPLAGPVVAAAVMFPDTDIPGITDSKQLTNESDREILYEQITTSRSNSDNNNNNNIRWAVAVVNAAKIDEINILAATLLAMRMATSTVMNQQPILKEEGDDDCFTLEQEASIEHEGCYVVAGGRTKDGTCLDWQAANTTTASATTATFPAPLPPKSCYALVDGNKVPDNMPCDAEFVIKGDGREYIIATASILAKVTRDRLLHQYDVLYPQYGFAKHKGYGTKVHMEAIYQHGACPIHRRTFAPLKHMQFDANGGILVDKR